MRLSFSRILALATLALFSTELFAQASYGDQSPVIRANARAVVLDVVVTKGNDEPATALHKDDFEVLEDGKPQTIDFFEEHTAKTLPPGALAVLPKMPPNVYTNVPPAPENDAVNVLLLDSLNTERQDQIYVHNQILQFLKNMPPGTRAAIFTLGSKLRFIQGFTTDSSLLVAAVNDKKNGFSPTKDSSSHSSSDAADDARDVATLTSMLMGNSDAGIEALKASQAEFGQFELGNRMAMTLEALDYLGRYLAGIPGRKNLIWFASSFPIAVFPNLAERERLPDLRNNLSQVKQTADLLTVSNIAVYPISAEGVMTEHMMEADNAGPSSMGNIQDYAKESSERAVIIQSMEQLASDTGGKAFYNTNDLNAAMARAVNDGSHYYTLIYSPTNKKMDGSYRSIQVKLTQGKYKLAYRRGYNADDTLAAEAKPEADPLRPLLIRGLPSTTEVLFGARVAPASPQPAPNATRAGKNPKLTGPVTRYSIDLMIRWRDVKLEPAAEGMHTGKLQLSMMAYDRDGNAVNWAGATMGMNLKPDIYAAIQKSGVPAHMEIDVPNTDVWLEIGVYDWNSGKAGTLEVPLHPTAAATSSAAPQGKSSAGEQVAASIARDRQIRDLWANVDLAEFYQEQRQSSGIP
jgi:VWFA-related protein